MIYFTGKPSDEEKRRDALYKQGDTVLHSHHGIGTIQNIEEKEILGSKAVFVTMYFDREGLQLTVGRKNLDEQIREILDRKQAKEVLEYMRTRGPELATNWKKRNRNNHERLTSGDPKALCDVVSGLLMLQHKRKGELSNSDRQQLNRALELLAEELAFALKRDSLEELIDEIRETCRATIAA